MTVAELIQLLQTMPQDSPVHADGCDCANPVTGALAAEGLDFDGNQTMIVEIKVDS